MTHWKAPFLETLEKTGNITVSAKLVEIDRKTAYNHRDSDEEFAKAWDEALDKAIDLLEFEARRRGLRGVEEPVFQGGKEVGRIRKYSDTLLIFLLKANRPHKYRDNSQFNVNLTGNGSGAPTIQIAFGKPDLQEQAIDVEHETI